VRGSKVVQTDSLDTDWSEIRVDGVRNIGEGIAAADLTAHIAARAGRAEASAFDTDSRLVSHLNSGLVTLDRIESAR
jgi:hypothetical protein